MQSNCLNASNQLWGFGMLLLPETSTSEELKLTKFRQKCAEIVF